MRYALGVEYDGGDFLGWQRLTAPGEPVAVGRGCTVQAVLEHALSTVADQPIEAVCAGRTDAGVHARCQVVHFDTTVARDPRGWMLGATSRLPPAVCVRWCREVDGDFHARYSARARRYRYRLLNRAVRPALERQYLSWVREPLDAAAMHRAAQLLVGEHDFSAFRTVHCQAPHARRDLQSIAVARREAEILIGVQANAFLHHMVRNIVGSLLEVGSGKQPEAWLSAVLAGRDRSTAGPTAPACGLEFLGPLYPAACGLPEEVTWLAEPGPGSPATSPAVT